MYEAKVIADSVNEHGNRITTLELTYPRIIHAEIMTHRDRARNAASSRAIPWPKMCERIRNDPFVPIIWGMEQSGMQTGGEIPEHLAQLADALWLRLRDIAIEYANAIHGIGATYNQLSADEQAVAKYLPGWKADPLCITKLNDEIKIHKSLPNRLTEPWMWITVVMTATEWKNFYALRCHKDAEIHFQRIAGMARHVMKESEPSILKFGEWHLPYLTFEEQRAIELDFVTSDEDRGTSPFEKMIQVSTARCARVSYLTHDGKRDWNKDLDLYNKLRFHDGPAHACYDSQTEVLTENGWLPWARALQLQPKLAAVDLKDETIRFEKPSSWYEGQHTGPMYELKGQALDLLVTLNHNLVVSSRKNDGQWKPYRLQQAFEIYGTSVRHLNSGTFADRNYIQNPFDFSEITLANLVGFWCGDGTIGDENQNVIYFNIRRPRKIAFLSSFHDVEPEQLGSGRWAIRYPGIGQWFRDMCSDNGEKVIPTDYLTATELEIDGLFSGLKASDGSHKRNTWVYDSTSKKLIDGLQAVLHLNSLAGSVSVAKEDGNRNELYRLNVSERVAPVSDTRQIMKTEQIIPYTGMVYCATVGTGALLIRRNWKVLVCGNSPMEHSAMSATPDVRSGPFRGWLQHRKQIPKECAD